MSSSVLTLSSDQLLAEYVGLNEFRGFAETRLAVGPDLAAVLIRDGRVVGVEAGAHVSVGGFWQGLKDAIGGQHSLRLLIADLKPFRLVEQVTALTADRVPVGGELTFEFQVDPERAANILGFMAEHRAVLKTDVTARLMAHLKDRVIEAEIGRLGAVDIRGNVGLQDRIQARIMAEAERVAGEIGLTVRAVSATWTMNEVELAEIEARRKAAEDQRLKQEHELLTSQLKRESDTTVLKINLATAADRARVIDEAELRRLVLSNELQFEEARESGIRSAEMNALMGEIAKVVARRQARFEEELAAIDQQKARTLRDGEARYAGIDVGIEEARRLQIRAEIDQANQLANSRAMIAQRRVNAELAEMDRLEALKGEEHQSALVSIQNQRRREQARLEADLREAARQTEIRDAEAQHARLRDLNDLNAANARSQIDNERFRDDSSAERRIREAEAAARHAASLIEAESGLTAEQMKARKLDNQGAAQVLTAEANALAQRDQALTQALRDQIAATRDDARAAQNTIAMTAAGTAQGVGQAISGFAPPPTLIECPHCHQQTLARGPNCVHCRQPLGA